MRAYPYPDPGPPDLRSPSRYLLWLASKQKATLLAGVLFGTVWMVAQAVMPYVLGRAIDEGVVGGDFDRLFLWVGVLIGLTVLQAGAGTLEHRTAISGWLQAAFHSIRLIGYKVTRTGDALPRKLSTGEVVSTAASDATRLGEIYAVSARLAGSIVAWLVVCVLIAQTSLLLGIIVLVGVPACCALLLFVVRPLQARQREQREASGKMTAVGADTVAGLRVLRGIGGEHIFVNRYRERSATTRDSGIRVAYSLADLEASQVFIAGAFSVLFTWVGANLALSGDIEPGQLVALYGYSIFLMTPIRAAADSVARFIRAHVGARKIIAVLVVEPDVSDQGSTAPAPPPGSVLHDARTGTLIHPGRMTAVVSVDTAASAELATRLGRFEDEVLDQAEVRWGPVPLHNIALADIRRRIVVSEANPQLFTGSLRSQLDPQSTHDDSLILAALDASSALDILDGVDDGLDHEVTERGRGFSGGQRQRLVLARALLTEAETLVLIEPTSAVDAHTESRIATRLKGMRGGSDQTTVVVTASPLMLGVMDHVVYLEDGQVVAEGTHQDLLSSQPAYRNVVIRSE
ncbi:ABC transporter ATP-binding protein [Arthrobacter sp. H20]|uniref:ABC transporter ATP-binding protein n=1 Tax=Arthrobacter sp. H20 TaxID=1267981 RepID=UPI00047D2BAC|nr:ABC transporter ATP-binding protein [Arthrobacter sp. H20]